MLLGENNGECTCSLREPGGAALSEKVIVSPNDLEVRLRANGIERLVLELRPEPVEQTEEAMA